MTIAAATVPEPAREIPVVDEADVVVIGYLGGATSGSLVLVWDDCDDGTQKTVGGVLDELVEAARQRGGAMLPDLILASPATSWSPDAATPRRPRPGA